MDPTQIVTHWWLGLMKSGPAAGLSLVTAGISLISLLNSYRALRQSRLPAFRDIDDRAKALAFWNAWYTLQQSVGAPEALEAAKVRVRAHVEELAQPPEEPPDLITRLREWFLFSRPSSPWSWAARVAFYAGLVGFLILSGVTLSPIAAGAADESGVPWYLGYLTALLLVIVVLRAIAAKVEASAGAAPKDAAPQSPDKPVSV